MNGANSRLAADSTDATRRHVIERLNDPEKGFGKPTIPPKTPFQVKDLHGSMRLRTAIDLLVKTVDNRVFPTSCDVESRRSKKTFPQYER